MDSEGLLNRKLGSREVGLSGHFTGDIGEVEGNRSPVRKGEKRDATR